jgi:hypothetical protein
MVAASRPSFAIEPGRCNEDVLLAFQPARRNGTLRKNAACEVSYDLV